MTSAYWLDCAERVRTLWPEDATGYRLLTLRDLADRQEIWKELSAVNGADLLMGLGILVSVTSRAVWSPGWRLYRGGPDTAPTWCWAPAPLAED